jgi:hypothetical protein
LVKCIILLFLFFCFEVRGSRFVFTGKPLAGPRVGVDVCALLLAHQTPRPS